MLASNLPHKFMLALNTAYIALHYRHDVLTENTSQHR